MKPRPTPETDPDAVPLPATWQPWTAETIEAAMPLLLELAAVVARIAERVERKAPEAAETAA